MLSHIIFYTIAFPFTVYPLDIPYHPAPSLLFSGVQRSTYLVYFIVAVRSYFSFIFPVVVLWPVESSGNCFLFFPLICIQLQPSSSFRFARKTIPSRINLKPSLGEHPFAPVATSKLFTSGHVHVPLCCSFCQGVRSSVCVCVCSPTSDSIIMLLVALAVVGRYCLTLLFTFLSRPIQFCCIFAIKSRHFIMGSAVFRGQRRKL